MVTSLPGAAVFIIFVFSNVSANWLIRACLCLSSSSRLNLPYSV